jgi:hypothetical protein
MKTIIQLAGILLVLLFFTTCKKEIRQTFVEGIAQDYYTKQPIADAQVELIGPGGDQHGVITSVYTDANGHFEFEKFRAEKSGEYYIHVTKGKIESYFNDGKCDILKGTKNKLTPVIIQACYISINFNDTSNISNSKFCFKFDYSNEKVINNFLYQNWSCSNGLQLIRIGQSFSKNIATNFQYTVTRGNVETNFGNTILVNNDTTININF